MENTKSRDFTEFDWNGFAGADPWSDSESPLFREGENWMGIADTAGLSIYIEDPEDDNNWFLQGTFTKSFSRLALDAIPSEVSAEVLQEMGFTEI